MNSKLKNIFSKSGCPADGVLQKYLNEELSHSQKHDVEKHLLDCEMCSDELEGLKLMNDSSRLNAIVEKINNQIVHKTKIRILKPFFSFVRIAAVLLFLIIIGSIYILHNNFNSIKNNKVLSDNFKQVTATEQQQNEPVAGEVFKSDSVPSEETGIVTKKVIAENKVQTVSDEKDLLSKLSFAEKKEIAKDSEIEIVEDSEIEAISGGEIKAPAGINAGASTIAYFDSTEDKTGDVVVDEDIIKTDLSRTQNKEVLEEKSIELAGKASVSQSEVVLVSPSGSGDKDKSKAAKSIDSETKNEPEKEGAKFQYSSSSKKSKNTENDIALNDSDKNNQEGSIDEFRKKMNNNLDSLLNIAIIDYENDRSRESKLRLELILQYNHFASYQKAQWYYALTLLKLNEKSDAKKLLNEIVKTPNHIYLKDAQDKLIEINK